MSWYALRAAPSREMKAERLMLRMGLRVIMPKEYRQRKRYKGRRRPNAEKPIERPLYGNWLLVKFPHGFAVKLVRRLRERGYVIGFAADTEGQPKRIADREIKHIRANGLKAFECTPIEELPFKLGQTVKIADGPFHGFPLTIESMIEGRARGNVELFGRPTPIELEFDQLEAAS
jgi:transcription antitermination factor NusG